MSKRPFSAAAVLLILAACGSPPPPPPAAPPPPAPPVATEAYYLLGRDGIQCALAGFGHYLRYEQEIAQEEQRLAAMQIQPTGLWLADTLAEGRLPAQCIPPDANAQVFFQAKPYAQAGVVKARQSMCSGCGCPAVYYFCVRSANGPQPMQAAGYAPLP
ncbi:MAG: hypothetical protein HY744_15495 [Deltaproteobacteria bacterium]|nr:hypothetical protein [Deltaproteobacteria bacterium]